MKERAVKLSCPIDDEEAIVSIDSNGDFCCSHKAKDSDCATLCPARAILLNPEERTRMRIVCPQDQHFARLAVEDEKIIWCSHERHVTGCQRDCLRPNCSNLLGLDPA